MTTPIEPKVETRTVKHVYIPEEMLGLGSDLARAVNDSRALQCEFDKVKAVFKARGATLEATVDTITTAMSNGFGYRPERCVVEYEPAKGLKHFYIESEYNDPAPLLDPVSVHTEPMTPSDYDMELIQAESAFELREEIPLFLPVGPDKGILVVGRFKGRWYSALRITIGKRALTERLDTEQKAVKNRADAVGQCAKRAATWLIDNLGIKTADGFIPQINEAVTTHKEREE